VAAAGIAIAAGVDGQNPGGEGRMKGFGGFAKAFEAAIDKTLGIDAEEAEAVLAQSAREEGSLLDTAIGKDKAEKLKHAIKDSPQIGQILVESLGETAGKHASNSTGTRIPKADDFFADFGFLNKLKPDLKQNDDADTTAKALQLDDSGISDDVPAIFGLDTMQQTSKTPQGGQGVKRPEKASENAVGEENSGGDGDACSGQFDLANNKRDSQANEECEQDSQEEGAPGASGWEEACDIDFEIGAGWGGNGQGQEESEGHEHGDAKAVASASAAAVDPGEERDEGAGPVGSVVGESLTPDDVPRAGGPQAATPQAHQQTAPEVAGTPLPEPGPAAPPTHSEAQEDADKRVGGLRGDGPALRGLDAGREGDGSDWEKDGADAAVDRGLEVEQLSQVIAERERQLLQKVEECDGERRRAQGLEDMVRNSEKAMEALALENANTVGRLEQELHQEQHKVAGLKAEMASLRQTASGLSDVDQRLATVEAEKAGLMEEGKKLMDEKQKLEATLKEVRRVLRGKQEELEQALADKDEVQRAVEGMERELRSVGATYEKNEEKMSHMRSVSQETAKQLAKAEKEKAALQARAQALEKVVDEVSVERDEAKRMCKEATALAMSEAIEKLERELKTTEKEAAAREEALKESLENMQTALRRLEAKSAAEQQRHREEKDDLNRRCSEAETRCQELSSAVPDSTRPLLRQIESLQSNFDERARVWEQVEHSLRQRCAHAETEARAAIEKERVALDKHHGLQHAMAASAVRISALQDEVSRLGAELKAAKSEGYDARQEQQRLAAQLAAELGAAARRTAEAEDLRALQRRTVLEHEEALDHVRQEAERANAALEQATSRVQELEAVVRAAGQQQAYGQVQGQVGGAGRCDGGAAGSGGEGRGGAGGDEAWAQANRTGIGSGEVGLRDGCGSVGLLGMDPWKGRGSGNGSGDFAGSDSVFSVLREREGGGNGATGQLSALQLQCSALELERDKLAEQLALLTAQKRQSQDHQKTLATVQMELVETQRQLTLALELLGAREEELDDLRATMKEQKEVYQSQLEALLSPK
jgi:hypothetical protein